MKTPSLISIAALICLILAACVQATPAAPAAVPASPSPLAPTVMEPSTLPSPTLEPSPTKPIANPPVEAAKTTDVVPQLGVPLFTPSSPQQRAMADQAIQDLAQKLSLPPDQITLISVTPKAWPDTSLGCPQPGMMYAQIVQEGYLIVLVANGTTYNYHQGGGGQPFLCENKSK